MFFFIIGRGAEAPKKFCGGGEGGYSWIATVQAPNEVSVLMQRGFTEPINTTAPLCNIDSRRRPPRTEK